MLPVYRLLKKDTKIEPTKEHYDSLEKLKADLLAATETTLRLPKPGLKYVLLCDASTYGAGFVLMVEDYLDKSDKSRKVYAPVSFGSYLFNKSQLKFSTYYKEFLGLYYALENFAHFLWCSHHPLLILTDNKC